MGRFLSLIVLAALAYGGLYVYYGIAVERIVEEQLERRGLSALEVSRIDYHWLAPVSTETTLRAEVSYRGADATVTVRVHGHPVFSDEVRIELDGLQNLRLRFGVGG
ncbi:hypothetical protein [Halomonas sp. E19]|uniref:hypothetical protein n=1 Tax=unclassified Halomonas TaxID=2609666 RepID=UPI004034960C